MKYTFDKISSNEEKISIHFSLSIQMIALQQMYPGN